MPYIISTVGLVVGFSMLLFPAPWIGYLARHSRGKSARKLWRETPDFSMRFIGFGIILFFLLLLRAFLSESIWKV